MESELSPSPVRRVLGVRVESEWSLSGVRVQSELREKQVNPKCNSECTRTSSDSEPNLSSLSVVYGCNKILKKCLKNAEKSCGPGHIEIVKPNKAKLEIFAKYVSDVSVLILRSVIWQRHWWS